MTATTATTPSTIGLLVSGGLDSCILLAHLLDSGRRVQPFYVQSGLCWQRDELWALRAFLIAVDCDRLDPLVVFDLPLGDLYGPHWSTTGRGTPGAQSPDDAGYLPGRNILLTAKPAVWCQMHGIEELALALLQSNPFGDATDAFFDLYESALQRAGGCRVQLSRPFDKMSKPEVLKLGRQMPLELTFSCIAPAAGRHCGRCNKCAERQNAFQSAGIPDPTHYHQPADPNPETQAPNSDL